MGMVGGGQGAFIGQVHRMAAALDGRIQLVCGAFSQSLENTLATGLDLGLDPDRLYPDWEAMLANEKKLPQDERMEFVCIVTPNHLHVPIASAALMSGFHVMSDKPAGMSLAEVEKLANTVQASGRLYGLTHTYLGYPMVWQARHLVRSGILGALRRIYVEYPQGWLASNLEAEGAKQAVWRTDPKRAGLAGCMGDIGTHAHSLVEFMTDAEMTSISARLRTHVSGRVLDDDGEVSFVLANGATGVLTASQICAGEENALSIRIYGERGGLEWRQMSPNSLIEKRSDAPMLIYRAGTDKPLSIEALARCRLPSGHPEGYIEAFANLYRDFAAAIRVGESGTARGVPGIKEALSGMAFLQAVIASHQEGGAPVVPQTIQDVST
jgi:predicted dehydrogenase